MIVSDAIDVDEAQLYNDVKELIFKDCRDTTTWDHLGNLNPVRRPTEKKVHIVEQPTSISEDHMELLELPVGLGLLYEAASSEAERKCGVLIYALNILCLPPPPPDHCHWLHEQAMQRLAKRKAEDEARRKAAEEAELKECIWKPAISDEARRQPGKGKEFYKLCLDWERMQRNKLKKKVAKAEKDQWEETMVPWEMGRRSRYLAARSKSPSHVAYSRSIRIEQPRSKSADNTPEHSFKPVTNHAAKIELMFSRGTPGKGGVSADGGATPIIDDDRVDRATAISHLQQRIEEDIRARREREAQRREEFLRRQTEKLYDKISGQPLFEPNAMPTVQRRGGDRVPFDQLSPSEQKRFMKNLSVHRIVFDPEICLKHQTAERRKPDQVVKTLLEQDKLTKTRNMRRMNNIREQAQQECVFRPKLTKKSIALASAEREPLCTRKKKQSEASPSLTPQRKASQEQIQKFLQRLDESNERASRERDDLRRRVEQREANACTFKPKLSTASVEIVENAERRLLSGVRAKDAWNMNYDEIQQPPEPLSAARSTSKMAAIQSKPPVTSGSLARPRVAPAASSSAHRRDQEAEEVTFASPLPEQPGPSSADRSTSIGGGATAHSPPTQAAALANLLNSWEELGVSVERALRD